MHYVFGLREILKKKHIYSKVDIIHYVIIIVRKWRHYFIKKKNSHTFEWKMNWNINKNLKISDEKEISHVKCSFLFGSHLKFEQGNRFNLFSLKIEKEVYDYIYNKLDEGLG